ncbi:hypothetical protein [Microbacterium jejuense]|uniref:hypothetical protein n=1 Tax=Microbacterium jejuense TaxID=1263637 RepID=UPI0031E9D291
MSTFENPDAAPGADATPDEPAVTDTQATATPPLPETPTAEGAWAAETARLDDLTPPDAATVGETAVLAAPEPPAPAALPPAFTGFGPAIDAPLAPSAPKTTAGAPAEAASTVLSGPRTRWAGVVWGVVLAAIAALALWLLADAGRQAAVTDWMLTLSPAAAIAYSVLVVGAFALIAGIVGLVRRAQRAGERRRAASVSAV